VRGIKGLDDYSRATTYRIGWRHQQDSKANPYLTFAASVDIVSNRFLQQYGEQQLFNQPKCAEYAAEFHGERYEKIPHTTGHYYGNIFLQPEFCGWKCEFAPAAG